MTAWQESLRQAGGQLLPRVSRFLYWWRQSLLAWLPLRWQWALGWSSARLLLRQQGDQLQILREVGPQRTVLASVAWPQGPEVLETLPPRLRALPRHWLLPSAQVLRRSLRLPLAAASRLREVVGFEIDRQTPFTADQVSHDVRITGEHGNQIEAELVVLPRRQLEAWQQAHEGWLQGLTGIDVETGDGVPLQVNLLPDGQRRQVRDPQRVRDLVLALVALALMLLAAGQLLDNRQQAADRLRAEVERSARSARGVASERAQLQALVDGARFLEEERLRRPATLQVWAELTRLLPDGTYLEKMALEGDSMQLIGLSREANQLVALLAPSPLWQRANLTGVLQADGPAQGRDRFTLTAELQPLQAAAPTPAAKRMEGGDADATDAP